MKINISKEEMAAVVPNTLGETQTYHLSKC